jgi:hypothetical protein
MILVAQPSSSFSLQLGTSIVKFLCNFWVFGRLKSVTIYVPIILYTVYDPKCLNTACHFVCRVEVVVVVPAVRAETFTE